jgi:hypothetical protein
MLVYFLCREREREDAKENDNAGTITLRFSVGRYYKMGKKSKRKTKTKPPVVVDDVTITSDEVLFKDPPAKEDCPICFLPMPVRLLSCISLPDATIPCQSLTSRLQMRD